MTSSCKKRKTQDTALNQTWDDFEYVIVDDSSTDHSLQILKEYTDPRIKVITFEENKGVVHAWNVGLEQCTSEFAAIMDTDDIALSDGLKL